MLGIFFALKLNNWNQQIKAEEEKKELLFNVQQELEVNIRKANKVIQTYRTKEPFYRKVLLKEMTEEQYRKRNNSAYLCMSYEYALLQEMAIDEWLRYEGHLLPEQEELTSALRELQAESFDQIGVWDEKVSTAVINYINSIKKSKDWFTDAFTFYEKDEMIAYLLEDPTYLNEVSYQQNLTLQNYVPMVSNFRKNAIEIYLELSKSLGAEVDSLLVLPSHRLQNFEGVFANEFSQVEIFQKDGILNYKSTLLRDTSQVMTGFFYPDSDSTYTENGVFMRQRKIQDNDQIYYRISAGSAPIYELFRK